MESVQLEAIEFNPYENRTSAVTGVQNFTSSGPYTSTDKPILAHSSGVAVYGYDAKSF
jgi:hypothetical protein